MCSALLFIINNFKFNLLFKAKTEELHFLLDSVYVKYATAMNEKGLFKKLYKMLPFLKYDVNNYIENGKIF